MGTALRCFKDWLPPAVRHRTRQMLAGIPLLARLQLVPWRVDFVVGGAMKGGTSALSAFLAQHPELCMANEKEAHFFDEDENFRPGIPPDYAAYLRHFSPGPRTRLLGDATPFYLYWEPAPARIAAYNPRMKWILLLRQPAERAYSHWNMLRQNGEEPLSFAEALAREPERQATPRERRLYSYFSRGCYAAQLRRLFAAVPRKQVLALRSEELRQDHDATIQRILAFLGVETRVRIAPAAVHARTYETPLPEAVKRELTARFAEDIRQTEQLLGWDLSSWLAV